MKKRLLFAALALAGCGYDDTRLLFATDDTSPETDAPEFAGFSSADEALEYCTSSPDSSVCDEVGVLGQAWTSSLYYGHGGPSDPTPCFSPNGTPSNCEFPTAKQWRLIFDWSQCLNNNVDLLSIEAMKVGFREAALRFNGIASGVQVSETLNTAHTLTLGCLSGSPYLGYGGLTGAGHTQISTRDFSHSGPNGVVEGAAIQRDLSYAQINPQTMKELWDASCTSFGAWSPDKAKGMARYYGTHEVLHGLGYSHFTTGLMQIFPPYNCDTVLPAVAPGFITALGVYNGSPRGISVQTGTLSP
jgi:hypothetical protein